MGREIAKGYEPQLIEPRWAEYWVREELFKAHAARDTAGKVFSIVIPPPNVTGSLHIGHMLEHTEIDILTRWHRMRGYNTLYLPGTDHAGISMQRVVVRQLAERGIDYQKLGRDEFLAQVWKWREESGGTILAQMKQIGESCDWSRLRFTLSPELSVVVREVFVRLYDDGFIYRATQLVNWCPVCLTVLSDLEVLHEERTGSLWHIRYPVVDSDEVIVVATTRPETMLGDTAVAVHPADERYAALLGKKVRLPLMNREIAIIGDEIVEREFGTGAVKITPAHDPNDFAVGKRHGLAEIDVMTAEGKMNANAGAYGGLDRFAARKQIVADLAEQGFLVKVETHTHAVGICERSKTVVEPRISTQWFCRMKDLAAPAIAAVRDYAPGRENTIHIIPENRRTEFLNWMENIRDWTISRQLWWGHRIPAWYCKENGHVTVSRQDPVNCQICGSENLLQDPDVLDTWFSSALWPFSTLGWPDKTADLQTFYPTTALITGYDILFFWVARMAMMGIHFTGSVPFKTVYLHSLVRTGSGEKMSKSKGTGLDPVALNQQYGTDAMRFCLASMAAPGTDIVLSDDRLAGARNFANKIWNAARFLFVNLDKFEAGGTSLEELAGPEVRSGAPYAFGAEVPLADAWLFSRLARTVTTVNEALQEFRFHEAAQSVYQFFWGDFCDWYIEWVKPELVSADRARAVVSWKNLFAAFDAALRLLHPFMPFLTEELWQRLPQRAGAKSIALDAFPLVGARWLDKEAEREVTFLQEVIGAVRNIRAEMKLDPKKKVEADVSVGDARLLGVALEQRDFLVRLALLSQLRLTGEKLAAAGGAARSSAEFDVRIAFATETVDVAAELGRLKKEIEGLEKAIASKERQLGDPAFLGRAPEKIVNGLKATLEQQKIEMGKLRDRMKELGA
ncbi:MAG: valine--tRNA ligase [Candidatus Acidiferrum sp.]|jgi:valyl-tRNA synthetase